MLVLDTTSKSITVQMSGAAATTNPSFVTAYSDDNGTTFVEGSSDGVLSGASQVTLVSSPAASTRRLIKTIYIENQDTAAVTITVTLNNSGTLRNIVKVTLQVGDTWSTDGTTDTNGNLKTVIGSVNLSNVTGTLGVANGGTGLTSLTSGYVPYGNGTSAYSSSSAFNYGSSGLSLTGYTANTTTTVGWLNVGAGGYSNSFSGQVASFSGADTTNVNVSLTNTNSSATSYAAYAVGGNNYGSTYYMEMGSNSSTYSYASAGYPNNAFSLANANFIEAGGGDLVIGTWSSNPIHFLINGGTNTTDAMTINTSGAVAFNGSYGSSNQALVSAGSGSPPTWASVASLSTANTFTATQTFSGTTSTFATVSLNTAETTTVSATAATGTIIYYINSQSVLYYTTSASANWTVNIAFSSGTTLNTALATGQSVTIAFLVTQGSTAYYNTAVQVDGTTTGVTTYWQGGTAPTKGYASGIDVYTYTIIKTASTPTYTVLASQTQF